MVVSLAAPDELDPADRLMGQAVLAFLILAVLEVAIGFASGAVALSLGGLHNFQESPALGLVRQARQRQHHEVPSFWDCHIGPLAPAINAFGTLTIAVILAILELFHVFEIRAGLVGVALGLEIIDFGANAFFGHRLHEEVEHHDEKAHSTALHLIGDAGFSLLAIAAYALILIAGWRWTDPAAAVAGIMIIIYFNRQPIVRSVSTWNEHRRHGHAVTRP